MLRMSKLTDYGIVVMCHLARDPATPRNAGDISAAIQIAQPTVSKILKLLAREGLLESRRGAKGGYRLARPPEAITVTEIIDAMEGPIALTECSADDRHCAQEPHCSVRSNWQWINRTIRRALDGITLAEMVQARRPGLEVRIEGAAPGASCPAG
ncbi:SUF system Fe-S cluster assembly regulator [Inmirania thermothiophila]|uniref:BadM/Rrf2 family transcriptional regulator n=1 Tax=Inmirania thermothiophila TaxID=1750597 RepID=A0A3N1Y4Q1_9GAMM|nr:SUF system Fe-S cluster assembly regulator [Inmirania thermothiophila]ROR32592.1 BadM/Rrf2 family transcriptional regulator [Inmirania thermothiophila]